MLKMKKYWKTILKTLVLPPCSLMLSVAVIPDWTWYQKNLGCTINPSNFSCTLNTSKLQFEQSSPAKNGGAYFSAIFGQKFDLTTVLRSC